MAPKRDGEDRSDRHEADTYFRFAIVSMVLTRTAFGEELKDIVAELAATTHMSPTGPRLVSVRSIYRWLERYEADALPGLRAAPRPVARRSHVLPEAFEAFLVAEKTKDPGASIPEIIRRAVEEGVVTDMTSVDRCTVYRAACRLGLPVGRGHRQIAAADDKRRFAHAHRMQVVLSDFTHFRVGRERLRRAALIFIDDCSRFAFGGVVATSERSEVFLAGLYELICSYGQLKVMYFDLGPAFDALDTKAVLAALDIRIAQGKAGYREGRGKIERANRTFKADLLRRLAGPTDTMTDCAALTHVLNHYLGTVYNHRPHEGLGDDRTPHRAFHEDTRPFELPSSRDELRARFIIRLDRRVSADHVIHVRGVAYEVPAGYAGSKVRVHRHVLTGELRMDHDGGSIRLHEVDPTANAYRARARAVEADEEDTPLPRSAAQRRFDRDHSPLVDADGGFDADDEDDAASAMALVR
jgi:transposase InsO family protein